MWNLATKIRMKKMKIYIKLVILFSCLLITLRIFTLTLSKFESEAKSTTDIDIAFYLLKEDYQTMELSLENLYPSEKPYVYTFSISNADGEKRAEVDLTYDLAIKTTTNLPLTYELYMNESYDEENSIIALTRNEVDTDEDGTYFRYLETENETFEYVNIEKNVYQLVVYFPQEYNTENYQDIVESIEINIDAKQVIEEQT